MRKHPNPSKLRIRRETLSSLASGTLEKAAGGTYFAFCSDVCTYGACQSGTCPSVLDDCRPTWLASCDC